MSQQPKSNDLFSTENLKKQLRLARAWKKGGKPALRAELAAMYPEKDSSTPPPSGNPK